MYTLLDLQPLLLVTSSSHSRGLMLVSPVQVLREEKLLLACQHYIGQTLGSEFTEPRPWQLDDVFPDTTAATPIIFILSSGADPTAMLQVGHSAASTGKCSSWSWQSVSCSPTAAGALVLSCTLVVAATRCTWFLQLDQPCDCSRQQVHHAPAFLLLAAVAPESSPMLRLSLDAAEIC